VKNKNLILLMILISFIIPDLSSWATEQVVPKMTLKHAIKEPAGPQTFKPFINEREYADSPYEIASSEAEQLIIFVEKALKKKSQDDWSTKFISGLREGNGQYLKLSPNVYLIKSGFAFYLANMKSSEFEEIVFGYDIEIKEKGFLADGTGWMLLGYGGLNHGQITSGYNMISYINTDGEANVNIAHLVSESMVDDEDNGAIDCGTGDYSINGIAGEIAGYTWKEARNGKARIIQFSMMEKDCGNPKSKIVKKTCAFMISKGKVTPLKSNVKK
jgi:hypothetical protein